jgi:nicotinamide-nucleotide amidase
MMSNNAAAKGDRGRRVNGNFAETIRTVLEALDQKVVFAESCTGGEISASMTQIPGISKYHCGSLVTYRPNSKLKWLRVSERTIAKHTCESKQVASEMAIGALQRTPEASWAVSVVGHFGPDAPPKKDGIIYFCIARMTDKGHVKIKKCESHKLANSKREGRQSEAAEVVLTNFARFLLKWQERDKDSKSSKRKVKV